MQPRRAAAAGLVFFVIAAFYYVFQAAVDSSHIDYAGLTALVALGFATSIMAYVLFAGIKQD
jgi:hypothetical protein